MALIIMRNSMARKSVKMATKRKKVVCTAPTLTLDTAAFTGNNPSITHGWRPTSATIQPACPAMYTKGLEQRATQCNQVICWSFPFHSAHSTTHMSRSRKHPNPEEALKARQTLEENVAYFGYGYIDHPEELVPPVPLIYWAFRVMVVAPWVCTP